MARPQNCKKCNKPKRPRGKKFKELPGYCECGRPPVIDATKLQKLEDAFMNAMTDEQACAYAEIGTSTLYNYQNQNPEFVERKKRLKLRPDIKAKQTIVSSLSSPANAWRWAERRDPDFKPVTKVEHAGSVEVIDTEEAMSDEEKAAVEALRAARRKRIESTVQKME